MTHHTYRHGPNTITETGEWHTTIENETISGNLVLESGKRTLIGANVIVQNGSVLVSGAGTVLGMRPGSSLEFQGGNPDNYVGGGMTWTSQDNSNDHGLWVWDGGALDIQGTQKTGWNRTGTDATWDPGDEYWISPSGNKNTTPLPWTYGSAIPRTDPLPTVLNGHPDFSWVPQDYIDNGIPCEVMNVTRDVLLLGTGAAHIHMHSTAISTIKYCRIEGFGCTSDTFSGGTDWGNVLGRYALHRHHSGDLTGEVWEGIALVDTKGRGFVPHNSHGIQVLDCVSVNSFSEAFWWDRQDDSNNIFVDKLCVSGVSAPAGLSTRPRTTGIALDNGTGSRMHNSVVSGVEGPGRERVGFDWPEASEGIWDFKTNIAHNNQGSGLKFWTNNNNPHLVEDFISYHNSSSPRGGAGVHAGAYINAVRYSGMVLFEDRLLHQNNSRVINIDGDDDGAWHKRVAVFSDEGPAFSLGHLNAAGDPENRRPLIVEDCIFQSEAGYTKIKVDYDFPNDGQSNPWRAEFIDCDVTPNDFDWGSPIDTALDGTTVDIYESTFNGGASPKYEIRIVSGVAQVTDYS